MFGVPYVVLVGLDEEIYCGHVWVVCWLGVGVFVGIFAIGL